MAHNIYLSNIMFIYLPLQPIQKTHNLNETDLNDIGINHRRFIKQHYA